MLVDKTIFLDAWSTLHPKESGFTFNTLEEKLSKRVSENKTYYSGFSPKCPVLGKQEKGALGQVVD